jgi:hypothetical protein
MKPRRMGHPAGVRCELKDTGGSSGVKFFGILPPFDKLRDQDDGNYKGNCNGNKTGLVAALVHAGDAVVPAQAVFV